MPSVKPDEVVLQATDGKQAVCVFAPGQMRTSRLVPTDVLPSRQLAKPITVRSTQQGWESSDGRTASDSGGNQRFAPIGDVLPEVGDRSFRLTKPHPDATIALGIDLDILRKAAAGMGTQKITLFIPVPIKTSARTPTSVTKPVGICPANDDGGSEGIAVIMPLQPTRLHRFYNRVRDRVRRSEKRIK